MDENTILNIESDIHTINSFSERIEGCISLNNNLIEALVIKDSVYKIKINSIIDLAYDIHNFTFTTKQFNWELEIEASINSRKNSINVAEKWMRQHSEGKIYQINSKGFNFKEKSLYRSYYEIESSNFFYDCFEEYTYQTETHRHRGFLNLNINNCQLSTYIHNQHIIIESREIMSYDEFSEISYNILIAIGFISGKFIQDEVFTFELKGDSRSDFCYRKLRNSCSSIYQAITSNSYSYENFIGKEIAEKLYKNNILKRIDSKVLSDFVMLIHNNNQIQYALVLFNEANSNQFSLLVKNNCFYVVLEVLRKFYYSIYIDRIPKSYTSKGNTDKYITLFKCMIDITNDDEQLIKDRNLYLHGDIKDLEGQKMVNDMQKQITLIQRLILTYIGFTGHIVDHYSLRNNFPEKAFLKLNIIN